MNRITPLLLLSAFVLTAQGPCTPVEDQDGDGYTEADGDCDDTNPSIHPGAPEVCDGIDNDCDPTTDESCPVPAFHFVARKSQIDVRGEDNGRVEPNSYDLVKVSEDFLPFDAVLSGGLEYVSSAASQISSLSPGVIVIQGKATAGGRDDYGYGVGSSWGESYFDLTFDLETSARVRVEGQLTVTACNDPAFADTFIYLQDGGAEHLVEGGNAAIDTLLPLLPGRYSLQLQAYAENEMSGGGDAYPCGSAGYDIRVSIED